MVDAGETWPLDGASGMLNGSKSMLRQDIKAALNALSEAPQ
jgi:hypothetical protein